MSSVGRVSCTCCARGRTSKCEASALQVQNEASCVAWVQSWKQKPRECVLKSTQILGCWSCACVAAPESTTNSRSSTLKIDAGKHLIFRNEKNVALWCSFDLNTFLASFHAASRAPCSYHSVSSCEHSSNFGVGFTWTKNIRPRGFGHLRAKAFVNLTRWIGFGMSVHFRRIDFGGFMSWNTQPNCRASEDWRLDEFWPNFLSLLCPSFPCRSWHWSVTGSLSCQWTFFNIATALWSWFFLDLFVGFSSTWWCANAHSSPRIDNRSWSCRYKHFGFD